MNSIRKWSAMLGALTLAGCGSNGPSPGTGSDAATGGGQADASVDQSVGSSIDATSETISDVALETSADSGPETGADAGQQSADGGSEASSDATQETSADAAPETGADAAPDTSSDAAHETDADAGTIHDTGADSPAEAEPDTGVPPAVIGEPGYSVTLWASGTADYFNPDSIDYDGAHYWVGFQNKTTTDGSDGGRGFGTTSTIVEYTVDGAVVAKYSVPGHCDGLRFDPIGHKVWATSNEDGSPHLVSIDRSVVDASTAVTEYKIVLDADAALDHGGGYDDIRFLAGKMFVVASSPPTPPGHVQALDMVTISGTTATFTPVVYTDSDAVPIGGDASKALSLTDPDSLSIDEQGRLVLVSQADSQLIFISNPGMASQSLSVLTVATQPEDPTWITKSTGRMLLVDSKANAVYQIHATFTVGTVFTAIPSNSTFPGILATVDLTSGVLTPKIIGLGSPTGLIFVPSP
jgi:hypothetical protein